MKSAKIMLFQEGQHVISGGKTIIFFRGVTICHLKGCMQQPCYCGMNIHDIFPKLSYSNLYYNQHIIK